MRQYRVASSFNNLYQVPNRNMVSLKDLKTRMGSVQSIKKITASMKVVATSKLAGARRDMEKAREFWEASNAAFADRGAQKLNVEEFNQSVDRNGKDLYVVLTSDKGLCGSINSSLLRLCKGIWSQNANAKIAIAGTKGKAGSQTYFSDKYTTIVTELGSKDRLSFADVEDLVECVANEDFNEAKILSTQFNSTISLEPVIRTLKNKNKLKEEVDFSGFEFDDADTGGVLDDLYEHYVGCLLYSALLENTASEFSARMTSMDNATKNAGDMLNALSLQYNRQRQAGITTELIEIISGAETVKAVEE